jgi:hypothetical protein
MALRLYSTWLLVLVIASLGVLPDDVSQQVLAVVDPLAAAGGCDDGEVPQSAEDALPASLPSAAPVRAKAASETTRSVRVHDISPGNTWTTTDPSGSSLDKTSLSLTPLRL